MSENESFYVGQSAKSITAPEKSAAYTGVAVVTDGGTTYTAGDISGNVLEIRNPWGSQETANAAIQAIQGYKYQAYEANGANVNPAAELGDGVTLKGIYSGIFNQEQNFTRLFKSDIGAGSDPALDHEFPQKSISQRFATLFGLKSGTTEVNGAGLTSKSVGAGKVADNSLGTGKLTSGVNTSLGYADYSSGVFSGANNPAYCRAGTLGRSDAAITCQSVVVGGTQYVGRSAVLRLASGGTTTLYYLGPNG